MSCAAGCPGSSSAKRITPHSLRHTLVTMALDSGQGERDIAISTGNSDTRMVAYYDRGRDNISRNSTTPSPPGSKAPS